MEIDLFKLLEQNLVLLTFVVIGLGFLLGRIHFGSIRVGSTTGVLVVGLVFGHFGFHSQPMVGVFGFTLFMFSVGLQAGPSFFSVFLADGSKYVVVSLVVAATAFAVATALSKLIGLDAGLQAGLLAGALTSTPTLAGAEDAINSGLASLPEGITVADAKQNLSVGYALTYIFGTVGVILAVRFMPGLLKIDLPGDARQLASQRGLSKRRRPGRDDLPIIRAYTISQDTAGKTIEQAVVEAEHRFVPLKIRRQGKLLDPESDLVLKEGDVVSVVALLREHISRPDTVGDEVLDPELLNYQIVSRDIVVMDSKAAGKTLHELDASARHGCTITGAVRANIDLDASPTLIIQKGDQLHVTGETYHLQELAKEIGQIEEEIEKTDLITFSLGIAGGILLGMLVVKVGQFQVSLGAAGGLLMMGILLGYLRSIRPVFGRFPKAAGYIFMKLGLMLFMSTVGLRAGDGIVDALGSFGSTILVAGLLVTLIPLAVGYLFGRTVLKMNPALLLGSITGAMTSTPALTIVSQSARSNVPALGYAGTYTFANVLLTFAGALIMMI